MVDANLRRVLPSDEVPPPRMGRGGTLLRDEATTGTVVLPDIREVEVGGTTVLVTRLATGEVIAFETHCPHQGTPLKRATIYGGLIRCEQHKYVYDPRTGRNVMPTRAASPQALHRLKPGALCTYPVEEHDGWIWIGERPNPPPTGDEPLPDVEFPAVTRQPEPEPEPEIDAGPQTLQVTSGEEFDLRLPTRQRPNHVWQVRAEGGDLEVIGQRYQEGDDGLTYLVRAVAHGPGDIEVRCTYAKPWGDKPRAERLFTIRVTNP